MSKTDHSLVKVVDGQVCSKRKFYLFSVVLPTQYENVSRNQYSSMTGNITGFDNPDFDLFLLEHLSPVDLKTFYSNCENTKKKGHSTSFFMSRPHQTRSRSKTALLRKTI